MTITADIENSFEEDNEKEEYQDFGIGLEVEDTKEPDEINLTIDEAKEPDISESIDLTIEEPVLVEPIDIKPDEVTTDEPVISDLDVPDLMEPSSSSDLTDNTVDNPNITESPQIDLPQAGDTGEQILAEARKQTEFLQKIADKESLG